MVCIISSFLLDDGVIDASLPSVLQPRDRPDAEHDR
jgi:hypothetical protein